MATPPPPAPPVPTSNTIPASSFYRIKPLGQDNWLAWKCRIQAVLRERKLIGHIDGTISEPPRTDAGYRVWKEDDEKTQTQLWSAPLSHHYFCANKWKIRKKS